MRFLAIVAATLSLVASVSCSVNPVTGQKEFTLMSASQEVATGEEKYGIYQQQQGGVYVVDPELNLYVKQVGKQLAQASQRPNLPYDFVVLNNSVPNAWALPGGKIAVNRGLLALLDDEAQLAAVLGHEIVHAAARHAARQMTQAALMDAGLKATGIAAQKSEYGQWILAGAGLGANLWQAHYGRDQELEADRYGTQYMSAAGYDAQAAVELQQKLMALSEGKQKGMLDNLFASHPPSKERVERNSKYAMEMPGGDRNINNFMRATAQLRKDLPAYNEQNKALAAAKEGDFTSAMASIKKAISLQPKEYSFMVTLAQLQMSQKHDADALISFRKARDLNPEYYMSHLGMGILLKRDHQNSAALSSLEASMKLMPSAIAGYHLGELQLAAGNKGKAIQYFEFAAQGEGDVAKAAQEQLSKLAPPAPVPSAQPKAAQ